jgi:hypothetical protein
MAESLPCFLLALKPPLPSSNAGVLRRKDCPAAMHAESTKKAELLLLS